jgi:hypothetical protein
MRVKQFSVSTGDFCNADDVGGRQPELVAEPHTLFRRLQTSIDLIKHVISVELQRKPNTQPPVTSCRKTELQPQWCVYCSAGKGQSGFARFCLHQSRRKVDRCLRNAQRKERPARSNASMAVLTDCRLWSEFASRFYPHLAAKLTCQFIDICYKGCET